MASASVMALLTSSVGFSRPAAITLAHASLVAPHKKNVLNMNNHESRVITQECGRIARNDKYTQGGYSHGNVLKFALFTECRNTCLLNSHI